MASRPATAFATVIALAVCSTMTSAADPSAVAELKPTAGNAVSGTVRFAQQGGKVVITADITGLQANAEHGFHVHEKGDCSAPDGMSAGGHFNPAGKPHAHHGQSDRHAGDMPNLKADGYGRASYRWETDALSMGTAATGVVGRSVIVHRDADDYKTQPTGNSGPRLACGMIAAAK